METPDVAMQEEAGERPPTLAGALATIHRGVDQLRSVDLSDATARELLDGLEALEEIRRPLDRETDRMSAHVDASGAYGLDGHRTAKAALKVQGRVTGTEAHNRLRCGRMLRTMPMVDAAYARGDIPTESARAIARTLANPRIRDFGPLVDDLVAEQAAELSPDALRAWLRDFERLADVDGAEQSAQATHARRNASMVENPVDSSWTLRATFGALQGAAIAATLARFEDREFEDDWRAAKAVHGDDTRVEHLARTAAQRRADAVAAAMRQAVATPPGSREPVPLVNVIVDHETFEDALLRAAGANPEPPDPTDVETRRCQTITGTRLAPSDALAAAVVGHVRRVVVDGASSVIDVGRRRRLFRGCSRDAVMLQAALQTRDRLRCAKDGCDAPSHRLEADHDEEWNEGGATDVANGKVRCGPHNVRKHHLRRAGNEDEAQLWLVRRPE